MKSYTPSRRHTRRVRLDVDTAPEAERLDALAIAIESALAPDEHHPPTLVVAVDHGDQVELRIRALDHHPALELEGLVAPPSWWCLGVVSNADARPLDPWPEPIGAEPPTRFRVHVAHLVTRSGLTARLLRDRRTGEVAVVDRDTAPTDPTDPTDPTNPTDPTDAADPLGAEHGGGLLDDYLRCALGVRTPPPHRDTVELFAALWIHRVMNAAAVHRLLDQPWPVVAALHPVVDTPRLLGDGQLEDWALANLARAGELLAEAHPWERVRSACQLGIGPVTGPPAELAGWLDEGAFARLVMGGFGPIADLVVDLHELVRPEVHVQLVDTIASWGLLDGS